MHNLQDNEWLQWLYYEQHHWIPTYVKNTFWAVMSTTLCSESMNAFFDGYVGPKTTLKQFADQYDEALNKVEKENTKDFISLTSRVPCITHYAIEKQFQESYTNSKFKEVQDEIRRKMYCHPFLLKQEGAISTYQVVDEIEIDDDTKEVTFHVYFNEDELEVQCNCCLFEFRGILRRHAFSVPMMIKKIKILPSKYILPWWSKDSKQRYAFI